MSEQPSSHTSSPRANDSAESRSHQKSFGLEANGRQDHSEGEFEELINRARAGEEDALNEIIESCSEYLLLVANQGIGGRLLRKVSPSDLVQSTCLLAYQNIENFRGQSRAELLAWLRTILRNRACEANRHYAADKRDLARENYSVDADQRVAQTAAGNPSTIAILHEESISLRNALQRLPADYQRVIVLRNWERLTFEQAAQRMERSPGAVKKLWARAIQRLRTELADVGTQESR